MKTRCECHLYERRQPSRPMRRVVVHREEGGTAARRRRRRPTSRARAGVPRRLHPHVARHDLIQLAGCVGHDKVGPKFVTERSTHLLGNADEQPASALVCALACHLGQLTRWAAWYARRRCAGARGRRSCRGFGRQPSQVDRESGLGGSSEDVHGVAVHSFCMSIRDRCVSGCLEVVRNVKGTSGSHSQETEFAST